MAGSSLHAVGKECGRMLYHSGWWQGLSAKEVALFQLTTVELCLPMAEFYRVLEEALGREVFTCEFEFSSSLIAELEGKQAAPTRQEVLALMPAEKCFLYGV